jgi:hypothetical protein
MKQNTPIQTQPLGQRQHDSRICSGATVAWVIASTFCAAAAPLWPTTSLAATTAGDIYHYNKSLANKPTYCEVCGDCAERIKQVADLHERQASGTDPAANYLSGAYTIPEQYYRR